MYFTLDTQSRFARWQTVFTPAILGATGLLLAACAGDAPTGVANSDTASDVPTSAFTTTPGAAAAMKTSQVKLRTMPTVQMASSEDGGISASGNTTNSPWDMTYLGGPTVSSAHLWNIYVNCTVSCWSSNGLTPATYLRDLNQSSLIQVLNQYLDEDAEGQYSVSQLTTTYKFTDHTAQVADLYNIIYAATLSTGVAGYHNIYNVFLPPGTNTCVSSTECYSPDNYSTFVFCAYHASVTINGEHILYTVQPYQFVTGCPLPTQTRVIDATASALSHETFETISDPDVNAWINILTGNEMSDECFGFRFPDLVGQHTYVVQEEYSNQIQDCTYNSY